MLYKFSTSNSPPHRTWQHGVCYQCLIYFTRNMIALCMLTVSTSSSFKRRQVAWGMLPTPFSANIYVTFTLGNMGYVSVISYFNESHGWCFVVFFVLFFCTVSQKTVYMGNLYIYCVNCIHVINSVNYATICPWHHCSVLIKVSNVQLLFCITDLPTSSICITLLCYIAESVVN